MKIIHTLLLGIILMLASVGSTSAYVTAHSGEDVFVADSGDHIHPLTITHYYDLLASANRLLVFRRDQVGRIDHASYLAIEVVSITKGGRSPPYTIPQTGTLTTHQKGYTYSSGFV